MSDIKDNKNVPTPHNEAEVGDFAETVLMPGDPLRARRIAKEFLDDAKLVNNIRNVQGYTGYYKGVRVSTMASGMGMPSITIYSHELFNYYNVKNIIRVGSIGALQEEIKIGDLIIASACSTDSSIYKDNKIVGDYSPSADPDLLMLAYEKAKKAGCNFVVGNILSSDKFYASDDYFEYWKKRKILGIEMEAAALYYNAAMTGNRAVALETVSDNISGVGTAERLTAKERELTFDSMIEIGLEMAFSLKGKER